jgi:hypothetical protein
MADDKDAELLKEIQEALKEKEAAKGIEKAGKDAWGKGGKK